MYTNLDNLVIKLRLGFRNRNVYTPIIAFTSAGTMEEYSVFGVNDMLQKPFTTESLKNIFDKSVYL